MPVQFLNLDNSYPVADTHSATGTVRYIKADDPLVLSVFNRVFGDVNHKFVLHQAAINSIIDELRSNPYLQTFDDTPYVKTDGSHALTGPVAGATPTQSVHLATKGYVDGRDTDISGQVGDLQNTLNDYMAASSRPFKSAWIEAVWHAGVKERIALPLVIPEGVSPNFALTAGVTVVERLDVAQPSSGNPNPAAKYVYQTLSVGAVSGYRIDAAWLDATVSPPTVNVLVPNTSAYSPYPGVAEWGAIASPRSRHLMAVVEAPVV